jgi:hypothetical protein
MRAARYHLDLLTRPKLICAHNPMRGAKGTGTLLFALYLGVLLASHCEASTEFYVDPDWAGTQTGTASLRPIR